MLLRRALPVTIMLAAGLPLSAQEIFDRITINGYTSFEFEKQLDADGNGDKNGSFDVDGFDLVLNVHATERVRFAADLAWEHGPETESGRGNVVMEYGFVEYTLSDLFKFRAGKMFTPFGVFNEIHTAKPAFLTVKEAASLNKTDRIVDDAFRFYPRWGAGIGLHGDGVIGEKNFSYDLQISNGDQENTNPFEEDDNGFKAVAGRVRYEPSDSLRFGYSFYVDESSNPELGRIVSNGLEAELALSRFRLLSEVAIGKLTPDVAGRASVSQVGFYLQPSWHLDSGVTPYMRLEFVDPNTNTSGDHGIDWIVGVNWEIAKSFQLKAEHNYFKGGENSSLATFPGRGYSEIKTAVVLGF